ncbi:Pentatricopeptide repeat-containing -like protein [Gossypium arboreum]|uniref:Pentatricopeptide repeat-containing-like protein n=1 Tax=Gossypium arboreum TaxID=29729 RepID=A0A0B0MXT3_GOSAR|nr:Pentatricopeptide repeat-containing -like protein [Gossypium arboreum]
MGFDPCKGMFMVAIYALGSMAKPTLKRKFEAFKKFTWSDEEISEAFRRYPSFIRLSVDNLMVTMDFLVNKMGCSPSFIAKRPRLLLMSMEKKIVPRFLFAWDLLSKGVIKNINLHALLETSEHLFIEKFVNCYKPEEASRMLKLYHEKLDLSKNLRMDGLRFQPARVAMMFPRLLLQVFLIVVINYCCFCCFRCFNLRNPFWGPATTLRQL